mgnify:CR=1 FL=1
MIQEFSGVKIEAISACVPKKRKRTEDFSDLLDPKEIRKFNRTTGISERRYVTGDVTATDLGYAAATNLLEEVNDISDIKALIFVSQTADYKIPFSSNILQSRLKLNQNILCLDINAGCAGFVQGLATSYALAQSIKGKVLLIVAETLSKILSSKDKTTTTLFGDGASAILIGNDKKNATKSFFDFYSDGAHYEAIIIPDGGYKNPVNENTLDSYGKERSAQKLHLRMDGPKVFDFTLREIPKSIEQFLDEINLMTDQVDYFFMHQSNKFIIEQIGRNLQLNKQKIPINIQRFGNTSGVSIPLLIVTTLHNKISEKLNLILTGYGSGLNWGNSFVEIDGNTIIKELIEI